MVVSFRGLFNQGPHTVNSVLNIISSVYYSSLANTYNIANKERLRSTIEHSKRVLDSMRLHRQEPSTKESYTNNVIRCSKFRWVMKKLTNLDLYIYREIHVGDAI